MSWTNTGSNTVSAINLTIPAPISITVGGGGPGIIELAAVGQFNSYNIAAELYLANQGNAGAPLTGEFTLSWFADPAGAYLVAQENWVVWLSNNPSIPGRVSGTGPIRGPYMSLTFQVAGSGGGPAVISQLALFGASQTVVKSDWRMDTGFPVTTGNFSMMTSAEASDINAGLLADVTWAAGANATAWQPLGLESGQVYYMVTYPTATISNGVICQPPAGVYSQFSLVNGSMTTGSSCPGMMDQLPNASGVYTGILYAAKAPLYVVIGNGATAQTIRFRAWCLQTN